MLLRNTEKLSVLFALVPRHYFQLRLHYIVCDYLLEIHIHDICLLTPKKMIPLGKCKLFQNTLK